MDELKHLIKILDVRVLKSIPLPLLPFPTSLHQSVIIIRIYHQAYYSDILFAVNIETCSLLWIIETN